MSMSKRTCSSSSRSYVQRHTRQPSRSDVRRHTCEVYSLCCLMPTLTRIMRAAFAHNIVASTHSSSQLCVAWSLYGMASRTVYLLALNVHGSPGAQASTLTCICHLAQRNVYLPFRLQRSRVSAIGLNVTYICHSQLRSPLRISAPLNGTVCLP